MIITISGMAGAGKGTVGRMLAERLHYNYYSMGDLRRKMALDRGMTIEEFNKLGEKESFTDVDADNYQKELATKEDNFIMEGRLSYHFIHDSLKIFLYVDAGVAAARIYNDKSPNRLNQKNVKNLDEQLKLTVERNASDKLRYKKYYGIKDFTDKKNFDVYIDTTHLTPEQVIDRILKHMHS
jgi:cytidylate kinase